jgi:hypothetical protein
MFVPSILYEVTVCPKCQELINAIKANGGKLGPFTVNKNYPLGAITLARLKEGSITMGNMTGCDNAPKADRQSRNVPICDNLDMVRSKLRELHDRLDTLKTSYAGEPVNPVATKDEQPPRQVRPMLLLVSELPGDLVNVADQISNAIEKVIQLQDMIL